MSTNKHRKTLDYEPYSVEASGACIVRHTGDKFITHMMKAWDACAKNVPPMLEAKEPTTCACGCPGQWAIDVDDELINKEKLVECAKGCGHQFHPTCYKMSLAKQKSVYCSFGPPVCMKFNEWDFAQHSRFCPLCDHPRAPDLENRKILWKNHEKVWLHMIWPCPYGSTIVIRPHLPEAKLKDPAFKELLEPGEVVDCSGYRTQKGYVLNQEREWEEVQTPDSEHEHVWDPKYRDLKSKDYYKTTVTRYFNAHKARFIDEAAASASD